MRQRARRLWQLSGASFAAAALLAAAPARATPITYRLSGTGSGTVAGTPFTEAAYVIRAVGDTGDVVVFNAFPIPHTLVQVPVTVTMEIDGVGMAALSGDGLLVNASEGASLALFVSAPSAMLRAADFGLLGYGMQSSFGPLVLAGPPFLSQVAQPSDLGAIILDSSSAVTFEALTTCGNGVLDANEACDDGNASAADCCAPSCRFATAGTVCRPAATWCDGAEACSGTSAVCPPDGPGADGAFCISNDVCSPGSGACQSYAQHRPAARLRRSAPVYAGRVRPGARLRAHRRPGERLLDGGVVDGRPHAGRGRPGDARLALGERRGAGARPVLDPTLDASYALCVYGGAASTLIALMRCSPPAHDGRGHRRHRLPVPTSRALDEGAAAQRRRRHVVSHRQEPRRRPGAAFPFAAPVNVQLRKVGWLPAWRAATRRCSAATRAS
ncbi:MAG: hypothetical protein U0802_02195 [Candidatus Binatia bacterium]